MAAYNCLRPDAGLRELSDVVVQRLLTEMRLEIGWTLYAGLESTVGRTETEPYFSWSYPIEVPHR